MKFKLIVFLLSMTFLTAACGTAGEAVSTAAAVIPSPTPIEILPTEKPDAVDTPTPLVLVKGPVSECTLVSSMPEPPLEYASVFGVTENDWTIGPDDAAVTLVEYGDFQ